MDGRRREGAGGWWENCLIDSPLCRMGIDAEWELDVLSYLHMEPDGHLYKNKPVEKVTFY